MSLRHLASPARSRRAPRPEQHREPGRARSRRRVQQDIHGHRGRSGEPLYAARRTLHTGDGLLTDRQKDRLAALFAVEEHVEVEATWGIYQRMIGAYRDPDRTRGRELMQGVIASVSAGVPAALTELITLGRTLTRLGSISVRR